MPAIQRNMVIIRWRIDYDANAPLRAMGITSQRCPINVHQKWVRPCSLKKTLVDKGTPQLHSKVRFWKNIAVKCQAYVRRSIWSASRQFPAQMVVAGVLETAAYPTLTSLVSTNREPGHKWQNQQILPLELHECHAITLSPLRGWARGPRGQLDVLSVHQ